MPLGFERRTPLSRISRQALFTALIVALACLAVVGLTWRAARAQYRNALWVVVHDVCLPIRRVGGLSGPCLKVDLQNGYAVLPDLRQRGHLVVSPTRRITGIEDPILLKPGTPNYWQAAWSARDLLSRNLGRPIPREKVGMVVNAIPGRSQDQLHIHLSCIREDVSDHLDVHGGVLTDRWTLILIGHHLWRGMALEGSDFGSRDPFKLLATVGPGVASNMGGQTLIIVGRRLKSGRPGFIFLSRPADLRVPPSKRGNLYSGHGEYFLDETCRKA